MRGDPQNVDISDENINNFLDFTNAIYLLQFTGGEPFLALDKIEYLLDECKKRNIVILGVSFVTNGTIINDRVVHIVKAWGDYISHWLTEKERITIKDRVMVGVSTDEYHGNHIITQLRFQRCKDALSPYATVFEALGGNIPFAMGRAREIEYAIPNTDTIHKVCYKIGNKCNIDTCTESYLSKTFGKNQVIVCCGVTLDVNGNFPARPQYEWDCFSDNPFICNVKDIHNSADFLGAIDDFNEKYPDCKHVPTDEATQHKHAEIIKSHPYKNEALIRSLTPEAVAWLDKNYNLSDEQLAAINKIYSAYNNRGLTSDFFVRSAKSEIERSRIYEETPAILNITSEEFLTQMDNNPTIKRLKSAMNITAKQAQDKPKDHQRKKKANHAKFAYLFAVNEYIKNSEYTQKMKDFSKRIKGSQ